MGASSDGGLVLVWDAARVSVPVVLLDAKEEEVSEHDRIRELLTKDGSLVRSVEVVPGASDPPRVPFGSRTQWWSVRAHWGWAEGILADRCYQRDAEAIALSIGIVTGCEVKGVRDAVA